MVDWYSRDLIMWFVRCPRKFWDRVNMLQVRNRLGDSSADLTLSGGEKYGLVFESGWFSMAYITGEGLTFRKIPLVDHLCWLFVQQIICCMCRTVIWPLSRHCRICQDDRSMEWPRAQAAQGDSRRSFCGNYFLYSWWARGVINQWSVRWPKEICNFYSYNLFHVLSYLAVRR